MESSRGTVIVVPGARYLRSTDSAIQRMILRIYALFDVVPDYTDTEEEWIPVLREHGYEVIRFEWSGTVSPKSIRRASRRLSDLLRTKRDVFVISCSLGTEVARRAVGLIDTPIPIISLGGVFLNHRICTSIVDIRSTDDRFAGAFRPLMMLSGRWRTLVKTVSVSGIRHHEFARDLPVETDRLGSRRISEVIEHIIEYSYLNA